MQIVSINANALPPAAASHPNLALPVVMTENDLCDRLADAQAGDVITYHVGMLAPDRVPQTQTLSPERCRDLSAVADRVLQLAEAGWVRPVQRRISEECFAYLLIVRPRPRALRGTAMPVPGFARQGEAA